MDWAKHRYHGEFKFQLLLFVLMISLHIDIFYKYSPYSLSPNAYAKNKLLMASESKQLPL